ncbi:MAG TPA: DUF1223 domain-containing protein [Kofleriaceae bacterium]|jgi:hypothetical protein
MRVAAVVAFLVACSPASGNPAKRAPDGKSGPVVVELFTSQGCSSCPPADKVLADLVKVDGVVPLSFHVDYWNDLGWDDPYSLPAWSERQRNYASALGDNRVFTPEAVIGGAKGVLGSSRSQVNAAIESVAAPALLDAKATWSDRALEVHATAPKGTDVLVAVYEEKVANAVPRGENSGETLTHVHVVRRLEKVDGTLKVAIDPAWKNVGAIVFAQGSDRKIVASASLPR